MLSIQSVPEHPSPLIPQAQSLFRLYGDFLRATMACTGFVNFPRYDEETRTLPHPYTDHGGELLLALIDDQPAACIAYRDTAAFPEARTAEIKRLFVHPDHRGQGLARLLTEGALTRLTARHYTRAILDTDTQNMPAALALYTHFGFAEYAPRAGNIAFLTRKLP